MQCFNNLCTSLLATRFAACFYLSPQRGFGHGTQQEGNVEECSWRTTLGWTHQIAPPLLLLFFFTPARFSLLVSLCSRATQLTCVSSDGLWFTVPGSLVINWETLACVGPRRKIEFLFKDIFISVCTNAKVTVERDPEACDGKNSEDYFSQD